LFDSNVNVDGKILPQSLDAAFISGQFNHVPLIQGTNHDEWRLFVALDELAGHPLTAEEYPAAVTDLVGSQLASLVLAQYPLSSFASPALALGTIGTDFIFACPARVADQVLSPQVPTFAYEFNDVNAPEVFLPPVSFPYSATHGSELPYLFRLTWAGQLDGQQQKLSDSMIRYWTQFAKSAAHQACRFGNDLVLTQTNSSRWRRYRLCPSLSLLQITGVIFWARLFSANTQRAARILK